MRRPNRAYPVQSHHSYTEGYSPAYPVTPLTYRRVLSCLPLCCHTTPIQKGTLLLTLSHRSHTEWYPPVYPVTPLTYRKVISCLPCHATHIQSPAYPVTPLTYRMVLSCLPCHITHIQKGTLLLTLSHHSHTER